MKKIKLLFLAMLGITIIPSAYAVPLDFLVYGHTTEFNDTAVDSTLCNIGNLPVYGFLGCSYNAGNTPHANFVKSLYSRFFFTYKTSVPSYITIDGVHVRDIGETREFRWSYFTDDGKQGHSSLVIPSRTAYQYTIGGKKNTFTEVFFYPYQFTFYDPNTRNSLTYVGKNKLVNGMLLANPGVQTDNVRLISLSSRKAWSITMDEQSARDVLLGRGITENYLKTLQFTKSYTVRDGGKQIAPETWRNSAHNEGTGFIYTPDAEFVAPKWGAPTENVSGPEAHRECINYYTRMHNLARFSDKCSGNGYDDQAMENFLAIKNWNGEGEKPQLTGSSAWVCGIYADKKKEYKELYKEQRVDFEKEFNEFMFSPDALIPANKCKFLEIKEENTLIKKIADGYRDTMLSISKKVFNPKIRDAVFKAVDFLSFGLISPEFLQDKSDTIADSILNLGFGTEEIKGEKGEVVTVSEIYADRESLYELERKMNDPNLTEEQRQFYVSEYNKKKQSLIKKYQNFSGTGFVASALGSGFKQGDFKVKSSNLFKKYYEGVLDSFNRGKSVVNFTNSCSGGFFSEINIFVYFFMILIGFYIFNLLK